MFKVGTMLKAREVRLSRKKPPYHPALIPGTSLLVFCSSALRLRYQSALAVSGPRRGKYESTVRHPSRESGSTLTRWARD
jgi:hypothetical protein